MKNKILLNLIVWYVVALTVFTATEAAAEYNPNHYPYVNIFWAKTSGNTWQDSGMLSTGLRVGYVWRPASVQGWVLPKNMYLIGEFEHKSQLMAGQPFNELPESWTDSFSALVEWRF